MVSPNNARVGGKWVVGERRSPEAVWAKVVKVLPKSYAYITRPGRISNVFVIHGGLLVCGVGSSVVNSNSTLSVCVWGSPVRARPSTYRAAHFA